MKYLQNTKSNMDNAFWQMAEQYHALQRAFKYHMNRWKSTAEDIGVHFESDTEALAGHGKAFGKEFSVTMTLTSMPNNCVDGVALIRVTGKDALSGDAVLVESYLLSSNRIPLTTAGELLCGTDSTNEREVIYASILAIIANQKL